MASVRAELRAALERRGLDPELADPWYFPSGEEYAAKLASHAFEVAQLLVFERPTPLPGDLREWLLSFAQAFLAAVPPREQEPLLAEVREKLRATLQRADGSWVVDYVRLRFRAVRR